MAESINTRMVKVPDELTSREIRTLLQSILTDLAAIKTAINTHTHSGVTAGAASTGAANANTMGTLNTTA